MHSSSQDLLGLTDKMMKRLDKIIIDPEHVHKHHEESTHGKGELENKREPLQLHRNYDGTAEERNDNHGRQENANTNKPIESSPIHEGSPTTKNYIFK